MKRTKKSAKKSDESVILRNQLARALADYDNLVKRVEKEREEMVRLASLALFEKLMPVFDMLTQAQKHIKDDGLEHIVREFKKVLEEEGIINIEVREGEAFDEKVHEAVEVEEVNVKNKKGLIAGVIMEGWRFKDGPVIRPTKVKVYGEKVEKKEQLEEEMARGDYV